MNDPPPTQPLGKLPRWQAPLILVGFPLLYLANSFMPWSYGLFAYHDRSCYPPFGISILVLHWLSVAWAASFIRGAALTMAEVGCLFYYLAGLIFAIIFLWRKSLAPGMYLHALFDVMALLAV